MTKLEDWQIDEIEDTLRLCSNVLEAPKRESCLARMIMVCRNWIWDAKHDVQMEETSKNGVMYRMRVGQVPGDGNMRYENGKKLKKRKGVIDLSDANEATQRQMQVIFLINKMQDWFNSLSDAEKLEFAEKYPEFVTKKEG